jgi:hypothetical protein
MRVLIVLTALLFGFILATGSFASENVEDVATESVFTANANTVSETGVENTSGGAIFVPEIPSLPPTETPFPPDTWPTEMPGSEESGLPEGDLSADESDFLDTQEEQEISPVLNVIVPATVSISIDPLEINRRGQVYSDEYTIQNFTDADVILTFTDMRVIFANDADFEALAAPFDENTVSDRKAIQLVLNFGRNDIAPVVLTDANRTNETSVRLRAFGYDAGGAASSLSLSFAGSVNHAPAAEWLDGDVKLLLEYRLDAVPDETDII